MQKNTLHTDSEAGHSVIQMVMSKYPTCNLCLGQHQADVPQEHPPGHTYPGPGLSTRLPQGGQIETKQGYCHIFFLVRVFLFPKGTGNDS